MQEFWYLLKSKLLIYIVSFALALPSVYIAEWFEKQIVNPAWPLSPSNSGLRELAWITVLVGAFFLIGRALYLKLNHEDEKNSTNSN